MADAIGTLNKWLDKIPFMKPERAVKPFVDHAVKVITSEHPETKGQSLSVTLESGGTVTLTVDQDPFTASDRDYKWVRSLIEGFRDYKAKTPVK